MNNKIIKQIGIISVAAIGLSACSINVTEDDMHWRQNKDAKKIVCEMVDKDALKNPEDCEVTNRD